jgi:hypothetical protein
VKRTVQRTAVPRPGCPSRVARPGLRIGPGAAA